MYAVETAKMSSKGQLVIPDAFRKNYSWKAGMTLLLIGTADAVVLQPLRWIMMTMSDNELRATCFDALVKQVGYLGTERFIVLMNRNPEDYTAWHERRPDAEESIEDLGAKIMMFSPRQTETQVL